ncbi:uncharacterized protein G2W53_030650 [Senna tora]|uniref:Uncharacterized protein n=1 Tax=Senna tora TaxID=362788 RepID=A0A834WES7_9FABA|nr:uncharacterized protein G2W53_030650 [Senna tora]
MPLKKLPLLLTLVIFTLVALPLPSHFEKSNLPSTTSSLFPLKLLHLLDPKLPFHTSLLPRPVLCEEHSWASIRWGRACTWASPVLPPTETVQKPSPAEAAWAPPMAFLDNDDGMYDVSQFIMNDVGGDEREEWVMVNSCECEFRVVHFNAPVHEGQQEVAIATSSNVSSLHIFTIGLLSCQSLDKNKLLLQPFDLVRNSKSMKIHLPQGMGSQFFSFYQQASLILTPSSTTASEMPLTSHLYYSFLLQKHLALCDASALS